MVPSDSIGLLLLSTSPISRQGDPFVKSIVAMLMIAIVYRRWPGKTLPLC